MSYQGTIRKTIVVILCAVLAVVFSAAAPGARVHAATKYKLPSEITGYYQTEDGLKEIYSKATYKYNKKGDIEKAVIKYYDGGEVASTFTYTLKYKYKKGKKSELKIYLNDRTNPESTITFDKKGRISKESSWDWSKKYKYGKKGYLASVKETDDMGTSTIKYTTKLKKGKATKITVRQRGVEGTTVKYVYKYNKKGLISSVDKNGYPVEYGYSYKKGQVVRRLEADEEGGLFWYDYKYSNKKVSKDKYAKVINQDERVIAGHIA